MDKIGLCKCGCGEKLIIAKRNKYRKNLPVFISGHNSRMPEAQERFRKIVNSKQVQQKMSATKKRLYREGKIQLPSRKGMKSTMKGSVMSDKAKAHLVRLNTGKQHSTETKEKLRQIALKNGSGKHMTGKKLSKETKQKISDAHKGLMPANIGRPGKFGNIKRGYFDINGVSIFFRSKWEANYALFLDFLKKQGDIIKWEYEVDVFVFDKIKSGTRSYRPDFKIHNKNNSVEYHEVKGWMTPKSKTQIKRMAKYYPDIILILIESKQYNNLKSKMGQILGFY